MLSADECVYLRQIPLFASLDGDALVRVGAAAAVLRYDRGEIIAAEGDVGGSLRFVRVGLVKLATTSAEGHEQVLRLVPAGQSFNLVAVLDGEPSAAAATALDPTTIYAISRDVVTMLLAEQPTVAQAAVLALAADTREMIALAKDLSLYHVSERVARLLLDQEHCTCDRCRGHYMTQQEMASIVGTVREVVGRTLHDFQAAGIIDLHGGHVVVRDRDRLRLIARERKSSHGRPRQPAASHDHDEHPQTHARPRPMRHPTTSTRGTHNGG